MNSREYLEILHVDERLKDTPRHCTTTKRRTESVAEHSWRISLMAFLLKHECDEVPEGTDPELIERKRRDIASAGNQTFAEILRRPAISYDDLAEIDDEGRPELGSNEKTEVEVMLKYDGYIRKQISEVEKMRNLESKKLSESLDYNSIRGLRLEARQKLSSVRPLTVGQASRISGVSPADINVLLIYLEKELRSSSHNDVKTN